MKQLENTFKALSDPNRMRIVNLLLYGESCVCRLQEILRKSQPKISRHLAYLKNSEVVKDRREGTKIYYSLRPQIKKSLAELLKSLRRAFLGSSLLEGDLVRLKQSLTRDGDYFMVEHALPRLPNKRAKKKWIRRQKR